MLVLVYLMYEWFKERLEVQSIVEVYLLISIFCYISRSKLDLYVFIMKTCFSFLKFSYFIKKCTLSFVFV